MVAEAIGESLLRGLMLFGGFVLVFSLSTRTFPTIVLAFVCLLLPNIAYNALTYNTESPFSLTELLFPVSPAASTFLNCLIRILFCQRHTTWNIRRNINCFVRLLCQIIQL